MKNNNLNFKVKRQIKCIEQAKYLCNEQFETIQYKWSQKK